MDDDLSDQIQRLEPLQNECRFPKEFPRSILTDSRKVHSWKRAEMRTDPVPVGSPSPLLHRYVNTLDHYFVASKTGKSKPN